MTREQLKPLAKQFFKLNSDVKQIFITEDKHCWYTEMHAIRHCKPDKEYFKFTPKDFEEKPQPEVKPKPQPKTQNKPKKKEE